MSDQKSDRTGKELLEALNHLFSEVDPQTSEEIAAVIKVGGYDPDAFAMRIKAVAEQAMSNSPLNWRNKARIELEQERKRLKAHAVRDDRGRDFLLKRVKTLLEKYSGVTGFAYAHHRNLDKASDDDLLSLIEELEHLSGLEKPEDDEN